MKFGTFSRRVRDLALLGLLGNCGQISLEGRPCPCSAGFTCCAATNVCIAATAQNSCEASGGAPAVQFPAAGQSGQTNATGGESTAFSSAGFTASGGAGSSDRAGAGGSAGTFGLTQSGGTAGAGTTTAGAGGLNATGHWQELPESPLSPRIDEVAVWAGDNAGHGALVLWSGQNNELNNHKALPDGALYFPREDRWQVMSATNQPTPRFAAAGVWTGSRVLIWGGAIVPTDEPGGAYDPVTDQWETLPGCPYGVQPGNSTHAVWTGTRLLVFNEGNGAIYDPSAKTWRGMSTVDAPYGFAASTVWTGSRWIFWGGFIANQSSETTNGGASYDPLTDTWKALSTAGAPTKRQSAHAAWTGKAVIVWGGVEGNQLLADGGRYDLATDTWQALPAPGASLPWSLMKESVATTKQGVLVWGGIDGDRYSQGGTLWNDATRSWSSISTEGQPMPRESQSGTWTGADFIIWGGYVQPTPSSFFELASGARYMP